ncbi:MAG: acyl-ACP--UDP-N-acetylglucosamine O-acyltransferase [Candidatus Didemnitutus sp.]|nr:acyl-ACP--UDP-N-acetylglucosamine O-acyltransferase [Candidatus Didemnitutus sp.]
MASNIHPTAIVEPGAQLGADVTLGAYSFVGCESTIGDGTVLHHHATVEGYTVVGRQCEIYPFTCIGTKTQDLKYRGGRPGTRIGDRNVFREYTSVHAATNDGEFTTIGHDNLLLAYCHVAHDCQIGNHLIASNSVGLAGHVIVDDHVTLGAKCGVHQFCRVGSHVMVGAMSKVVQDVPPYIIADGNPAIARSINKIGLERHGFSPERLDAVKHAFRLFYRAGYNRTQALDAMSSHALAATEEFKAFLKFVTSSDRGLVAGR